MLQSQNFKVIYRDVQISAQLNMQSKKDRREYFKARYQSKREELLLKSKEYNSRNKENRALYMRKRLKKDIQFRIAHILRSKLHSALKMNALRGSTVRDLGCTISEFKFYLEGKFTDGMTWDNWGHRGWTLDHVIPLSFYDLTIREEYLRAIHYTNIQPLWCAQNIQKRDKIITNKLTIKYE